MHSFTIRMHGQVQRESRARRKGDGNKTDSEDTEPEEEFKGEMNNFQDLQLGSTIPVVRHEALQFILASSSDYFSAEYGPTFRILTPNSTPPAHTPMQRQFESIPLMQLIYVYDIHHPRTLSHMIPARNFHLWERCIRLPHPRDS